MTACAVFFVGIGQFIEAFSLCGDRFFGRNVLLCVRRSSFLPATLRGRPSYRVDRECKPLCHISCRACKRGSTPRCFAKFPVQRRHELRQNGRLPVINMAGKNVRRCREDTRQVMRQKGFFFFFLNNDLQHLATGIPAGKRH